MKKNTIAKKGLHNGSYFKNYKNKVQQLIVRKTWQI
jgi:hypothetical protein